MDNKTGDEKPIEPYELFDVDMDGNIITSSGNYLITTDNTASVEWSVPPDLITYNNTDNILMFDNNTFSYDNPYAELEEITEKNEKEKKLRQECPALQEAWEQYQLILKLVEEEECDKYTKERLGAYRKR